MIELIPVAWLHAKITQARRNGMTYLRRSSDSFMFAPAELFAFSADESSSISRSSHCACSALRERKSAFNAASFLPPRNSHRGDSATKKLPITNKMPGGSETQKMLRHAESLNANNFPASPSFAT